MNNITNTRKRNAKSGVVTISLKLHIKKADDFETI
jgi:hypothetical protein